MPPNYLTVTSTLPGELSFSMQGFILLVLKNGVLSYPSSNPIWSGPISDYLEPSRKDLYDDVLGELKTNDFSENDNDFPAKSYNYFLERILYNIRQLGHGGTVILVPQAIGFDDPRLADRVFLKYATSQDYAWDSLVRSLVNHRRYYDLYFGLTEGKDELTMAAFEQYCTLEAEKAGVDEDNQDIAKSIASLTGVDGALVLTTHFKVLGFGGEIVAASPTLESVTEASDDRLVTPIESFGTRHRSAFRFCSSSKILLSLLSRRMAVLKQPRGMVGSCCFGLTLIKAPLDYRVTEAPICQESQSSAREFFPQLQTLRTSVHGIQAMSDSPVARRA